MTNKINTTIEGALTDTFDKYCHKKAIPFFSGVNGPSISGWRHKPDRIIGTTADAIHTKCVIVEIKPTREGAVNDLRTKEEYKDCKYLVAVYQNAAGEAVGCKCTWRNPTSQVEFTEGVDVPLHKLIDDLYAVYQKATNPIKLDIVREAQALIPQFGWEAVVNVCSGSFCSNTKPTDLSHSLSKFWNLCDQLGQDPVHEVEVLHDIVFAEDTRDERYKLGQFITEYPHTLRIAEAVVNVFDKYPYSVIYEPCVGTGAIAQEVLTLLFRKYGKKRTLNIITNQFKVADIDPKMRAFAHVVLWNHTEKLFGKGVSIKIDESNLETDSFDLSKMLVYGNYPFNKGTDRNYLARIIRKQLDSGLCHAVIMGNTTLFDSRRVENKWILGEDFFKYTCVLYSTTDFHDVGVDISVAVINKVLESISITSAPAIIDNTFTRFNLHTKQFKRVLPRKLASGESILQEGYNPNYSFLYCSQTQICKRKLIERLPLPTAPIGTRENEIYAQWVKENPAGEYPPAAPEKDYLLCAVLVPPKSACNVLYAKVPHAGDRLSIALEGPVQSLALIGLILTSKTFITKISMHFPQHFAGIGLRVNKLKTLPIPIETESNKDQFKRLYEIGQKLIIEGGVNPALRTEADIIIEDLYKDLAL